MKRMPRTMDLALQIQKANFSGENTHRILKLTETKNQDNRFLSSEMYELTQPSFLFRIATETLDDTIIINENRQEADYHTGTIK